VLGWGVLLLFLKLFFRIYGRLSFRGTENLPPKGPYMITPNHSSLLDAFSLISAMPFSVGKQVFGLGDTKFFGGPVTSRLAKLTQVIPVDMEAKLFNALQLSAYVLRAGKVLCVFPEGSRSRDGKIKEFKKGVAIIAKELKVPLVPVAITGTFDMMRPGQLFPQRGKVTITFGKPIQPGTMNYDELTKKLYGEVVGLLEQKSGAGSQ
jgi:long-chain acyl-CoA synthetase